MPKTDRVGCAGHGRHGGEAPALCVGSDDVGLEFLALLFQDKRTEKMPTVVGMTWLLEPCVGMTFLLKPASTAVSDHLSQQQALVQPHLAEGKKFSPQVLERCAYVIDLIVDDKEAVVYSCACGL